MPGPFPGAPLVLSRVSEADAHTVLASVTAYRESLLPERRHFLDQYRPIDIGFKVVGTGSVGLRDYVVYLEGNGPDDPLFLQVKEEARSGWSAYVEKMDGYAHQPPHEGQRVAEGQRAMQFQSDPFLGWTTIESRPYLVRQLNDHKGSIAVEDLHGAGLEEYARICGELLARGHARSGDAVVLNGYVGRGGSLGRALTAFGACYADQTEQDQKQLVHSRLGAVARATSSAKKAPAAKRAQETKKKPAEPRTQPETEAKTEPRARKAAKAKIVPLTAPPVERTTEVSKRKVTLKLAPKSTAGAGKKSPRKPEQISEPIPEPEKPE